MAAFLPACPMCGAARLHMIDVAPRGVLWCVCQGCTVIARFTDAGERVTYPPVLDVRPMSDDWLNGDAA